MGPSVLRLWGRAVIKKKPDQTQATKQQLKLYENASLIANENAKTAKEMKFMARAMVMATMPHLDPGDVQSWGRRNGDFSLIIQPGIIIDKDTGETKSLGVPYGVIPRLLLCWATTEAVKTKSRKIVLGNSLTDFMRKLDMEPTGGRLGTIGRFKNQVIRLFSSTVSCVYTGKDGFDRKALSIADEQHLWWNPQSPDQVALWESHVVLGERFFNEVVSSPVPIDFRALKALKKSPLCLDIYMWLTYRFSYLGKPTVIPWNALMEQFGSNYKRTVDFHVNFDKCLKKVLVVYRDANVSQNKNGLLLKPSKTSISLNTGL